MYYCGLLASFNFDSGVKVADLKHIQNLIDKEEQGLLIELPCKVGDTFWELNNAIAEPYVYPRVAHSVQHCLYAKERLGTICFLTQAEAEEALARMKGE